MTKKVLCLFLFFYWLAPQEKIFFNEKGQLAWLLPVSIENGDTIGVVNLKEVLITASPYFQDYEERYLYEQMKRRFLKVYPYAEYAAKMLNYHNEIIALLPSKRQKKKYIREVSQEVMNTYVEEIKKLTILEGDVLIKLIWYMTGQTPYDIIKKYKGGVNAVFWQTIASMWSHNLKDTINPKNKGDAYILYFLKLKKEGLL